MKKLRTRLQFLLAAVLLILANASATHNHVYAMENASSAPAESSNELLVKYTKSPPSIDALPVSKKSIEETELLSPRVQLITFKEKTNLKKISDQLEDSPLVTAVEPNYERKLMAVNDPYYPSEWWLPHVKATGMWSLADKQKKPVVVAVIDSGIDKNHIELMNRIAPGGYNFLNESTDVTDSNGHGTNVAGVIAAETNNGIGISGVSGNYKVSILPLKTVRDDGTGNVADNVRAIDYAISKHVDVINISQGGATPSTFERDAIQRAVNAGIIIVASSGNEAEKGNAPMYPASYDPVLSVGAVNAYNGRSSFSNFNAQVDLVAPGERILTTSISNKLSYVSGTSFAAPIVSGTIAMMKADIPELSVQQTTDLLKSTAIDLGVPGVDPEYGAGLVDLQRLASKITELQQVKQIIPVTGIQLDKKEVSLALGTPSGVTSVSLTATVFPDNATNRSVIWTSSNPQAATVDTNGKVSAVAEGTATITARTADGGFTASASVTVTETEQFKGSFPDMTVNKAKVFTITFNKSLSAEYNYKQDIAISRKADGSNPVTSFKVYVSPQTPTQLRISPDSAWEPGAYYVTIRKGLPATNGKALDSDIRYKFIVQ